MLLKFDINVLNYIFYWVFSVGYMVCMGEYELVVRREQRLACQRSEHFTLFSNPLCEDFKSFRFVSQRRRRQNSDERK